MKEREKSRGIGPLMIIVLSAVLLWALVTVVWSVPVAYAADPEILTITVTSSMGTYFYDPGLDPTGGTVYFNSLGGEGAGQVLTVTVVCSGTVTTFEGAPAFNDTPSPDTSGPPWQVAYTVEAGAGTQSGVVFTVTNAMSQTDTAAITFVQDNADPGAPTSPQARPDDYADTGEYDDDTSIYFTWAAASDNPGGSGIATYYAEIGNPNPTSDAGTDFQDTDTGSAGLNTYYVAAVDHVGNVGPSASDTITIDLTDPVITAITVASDNPTYFYDPGLGVTGGEVFFNSLGGEGGGQTIIVTVSWTDANPYSLAGDSAFGDSPSPDTSGPPWTVSYSVEDSAPSQTNRVFTVTDMAGRTDTATITFTQDNADPDITSPAIVEGSDYLYSDGLTVYYGDDMGMAPQAFTVQGNAQDIGAGLYYVAYSAALNQPYFEDFSSLASWHRDYTANQNNTTSGVITAAIYDRVGNFANQTFTYIRDIDNPTIDGPFIAEDSDYLHASGTTIYYSNQMGSTPQSFTVQGNAADPDGGAGLYKATFSSAFGSSPGDDPDPGEWSGTYNHVESGDSGDGTITVRVYDNVDNWSEQTFNYEEDTTPPTVELTDVTDPGHDENTNELDNNGSNWYSDDDFTAGGDGWQFTSNTSDGGAGLASGSASWDHSADQTDRTLPCGSGGDGTFSSVSGDADGTVTVTVVITDNVGNSASDDVGFNIDNTEPTITSPSIDDYGSPWLHVDDLTIYYGDDMPSPQSFRVEGQSADGTGVGLDRAGFSEAFGGIPSDDLTPATWSGTYHPDDQDWGSGTIIVTVYDLLGNAANQAFNYARDTEPPMVDVNCPALTSEPSFLVSWSGSSDPPPNASGLRHFDVQYKVTEFGTWQDWHTDTILIEDTFGPLLPIPVQDNTTYYFRVRAEDNVGNEQQYTNGEDATTYRSGIERVYLPLIISPDPNWGFEKGDFSSWQHGGELAQSVSMAMPRFGSYSALLGDPGYSCVDGVPVGSAWLSRSVMVPSSGSPTLSFWYRMYTQDKNSALSDQYDLFAVYINGSQLVVKDANTTVQQNCGSPHDLGWKQVIFPLSAYKGQFIEITFYNYNRAPVGPKWYNTYTYVDDVSVQ